MHLPHGRFPTMLSAHQCTLLLSASDTSSKPYCVCTAASTHSSVDTRHLPWGGCMAEAVRELWRSQARFRGRALSEADPASARPAVQGSGCAVCLLPLVAVAAADRGRGPLSFDCAV